MNDLSNSMGPAVGARVFGLKEAIIIAAIFELAGALIFGSHVTDTVSFNIIKRPPASEVSGSNNLLIYAMLASLLATSFWLTFASAKGWPVSTTHTLAGAIIGVGIASGMQSISVRTVKRIIVAWLITLPATSMLAALLIIILPVFI